MRQGLGSWKRMGRDAVESAVLHGKAAGRFLREAPGFAVAAILLLALGIGANSAMFSAVDAVLLRPLPYPQAGQLMLLSQADRQSRDANRSVAPVRLEDWNRMATAFAGITGAYADDANETSGALPERLSAALVAPRFLTVLGVAPLLGRNFSAAEEHFGGPAAALISYRLWQRRFGGDPQVVGKALHFGRNAVTVVGVMPASFHYPSPEVDLWEPSPPDAPYAQSRGSTWYRALGRLRPPASKELGQADLAAVQLQLARAFPATDGALTVQVQPLQATVVGDTGSSLWLLYGAVTLLLGITCANLAALLAARTAAREYEIGVRFSLGASRRTLVTQMLAEVLGLALMGALLGLGLAAAGVRVLQAMTATLPRAGEIALNWRVVLYALGCAGLTTLLCGLIPALRGTRRELAGSLAAGGRNQVSTRRPGQWTLVGVQVALSVVLLTGAGLLLRSMAALNRVPLGYDASHVLTFRVSGTWGETADMGQLTRRVEALLDSLRTLPGVQATATAATAPGSGAAAMVEFAEDGHTDPARPVRAVSRIVSAGYFDALHIPILTGEGCKEGAGTPAVVINQSFARLYFPGRPPLGHLLANVVQWYGPPAAIRGVVADTREDDAREPPAPAVYLCLSAPNAAPLFLVRTATADPASVVETIRRRVHSLEAARSVYDVAPLEARLQESSADQRLRTTVLTGFAALALMLAAVGLYATLSYLGRLRRRETGLRLTLGAARAAVAGHFLGQGLRVAGLGCAAGLLASLGLGRILRGMLFHVSVLDPSTYIAVASFVLMLATAAAAGPAVKAAQTEPAEALRER